MYLCWLGMAWFPLSLAKMIIEWILIFLLKEIRNIGFNLIFVHFIFTFSIFTTGYLFVKEFLRCKYVYSLHLKKFFCSLFLSTSTSLRQQCRSFGSHSCLYGKVFWIISLCTSKVLLRSWNLFFLPLLEKEKHIGLTGCLLVCRQRMYCLLNI